MLGNLSWSPNLMMRVSLGARFTGVMESALITQPRLTWLTLEIGRKALKISQAVQNDRTHLCPRGA